MCALVSKCNLFELWDGPDMHYLILAQSGSVTPSCLHSALLGILQLHVSFLGSIPLRSWYRPYEEFGIIHCIQPFIFYLL
jgi:hypothetical protein